jgi:hypothetical protein
VAFPTVVIVIEVSAVAVGSRAHPRNLLRANLVRVCDGMGSSEGGGMRRFGADVMAIAAIVGGATVAVGATALLADARDGGAEPVDRMRAVEVGDVRVRVRRAQEQVEMARVRADRMREVARERGAEARARAELARERAEVARERAREARDRARIVRARIRQAAREQWIETDVEVDGDFDFQFEFDFDYDQELDFDHDVEFDYDYQTGELRLEGLSLDLDRLRAVEGLEGLELRLEDLDLQLTGLGTETSRELEERLEEDVRRLAERLARLDLERGGR